MPQPVRLDLGVSAPEESIPIYRWKMVIGELYRCASAAGQETSRADTSRESRHTFV
jgi:hypothetical protein